MPPIVNKIGFMGAGNMAGAMIKGLLAYGTKPENIVIYTTNASSAARWRALGLSIADSAQSMIASVNLAIIAIKPQAAGAPLKALKSEIHGAPHCICISVMLGIDTETLTQWTGMQSVARVMPNTPSLVQQGASGVYFNAFVNANQKQAVLKLLNSFGTSLEVEKESDIDLVTAVSGCGPGYVFKIMESLSQAAQTIGLSKLEADQLILQTFLGSAQLAQQTQTDFAELRKQIAPLGRVTATGDAIKTFEALGLDHLLAQGLSAAVSRAKTLKKG